MPRAILDQSWPVSLGAFARIQLNFHAESGYRANPRLADVLPKGKQYIFQMDKVNDGLLPEALKQGIDAVPLFDTSGGAGAVPGEWPSAIDNLYNGYAGGLGPDTLGAELPRIAKAAGDRTIWIDMEGRIRSADNQQFDLAKCRDVLDMVANSGYLA